MADDSTTKECDPDSIESEIESENDPREVPARPRFGSFSRRAFLSHLGAAGLVATAKPLLARAQSLEKTPGEGETPSNTVAVTLRVNGADHRLELDPRTSLLDCLREELSLTGTKKGCDHGQCGACTVHVNGRRVNSCMSFAVMHGNDKITTIEGLGQPEHLHPMQAAFVANDGYQCGYCTSGQIMSAVALLREPWGPADEDVQQGMSGNICRCGAYPNIVAAVQQMRRTA